MKKTLNTGLLITGAMLGAMVAGSAMAADMRVKALPMAPVAPVPTWTGCSISGGVGYGLWNVDQHTETFPGLITTSTPDNTDGGRGWLGRLGVGCDYQVSPSFVIGAFGDYDFMNLKGSNAFQNNGVGVAGAPFAGSENESSAWYVGGRIGYLPYPDLMTFVSGGWTQTRFDQVNIFSTVNGAPPPLGPAFLPQTTYQGWFLGGGTEYAVPWAGFRGLYWKTEYRFAQYQAQNIALLGPGATPGFGQHAQPFVQTVTSSLVLKFNWGH